MTNYPKTLCDAVGACFRELTHEGLEELAMLGYVDHHRKYKTDFEKIVWEALRLGSRLNFELSADIALNHADELDFPETGGAQLSPEQFLGKCLQGRLKEITVQGLEANSNSCSIASSMQMSETAFFYH